MEDIIEGGPWLIQGQPIVLQCWEQGMSLRRQKHTGIPVWVRLKHLPMEYWMELSAVASGMGVPLYTDKITRECSRLDFARVCVMLDYNSSEYCSYSACSVEIFKSWSWFDNYNGPAGRIWLAWFNLEIDVEILWESQIIHCRITHKRTHTTCLISVLYGDCDLIPRRTLWSTLQHLADNISKEPWLVLGDFNAVIDESEVCGRAADTSSSMSEFRSCIMETGLIHLPFTGCSYTWHNCSEGSRSLWKRLDRVLANEAWLDRRPNSSYIAALPSTSDHSPLILQGETEVLIEASFVLTTIWLNDLDFLHLSATYGDTQFMERLCIR
ncbi:UNVERIFIED_CONTAM: hypothetical protein Sradi_4927900 [Sesamum radiatum]|uniref:Endonuclease/exonuclease/phosphatase domain-containing protein n=1 Tax=Sesamum radiatum TaxID=300843 RepID=A0AAW2MG34_SESRA